MKAKRKPGKFDPTVLAIQRTLRELEHLPSDTERDIFRQFFLSRWFPVEVRRDEPIPLSRQWLRRSFDPAANEPDISVEDPLDRHSVPPSEPLACEHGIELGEPCQLCTPSVVVKVTCQHSVPVGERCFGCEAEAMPEKVLPGGKVVE